MPAYTLSAITVATLLMAVAALLWLDAPAAEAAYTARESWLHGLARRLGRLGEVHWLLVPPLLLALLWRKSHPVRARCALFVAATVGVAGLLALGKKFLIGRARPIVWMESGDGGVYFLQTSYEYMSFPSGHAATAFAAMVALALVVPRLTAPLIAVAAILAAARVVSISHFVSDVVVGAGLGATTALILAARLVPDSAVKDLK
jgi:membrane-associated phospholipid phosphatase